MLTDRERIVVLEAELEVVARLVEGMLEHPGKWQEGAANLGDWVINRQLLRIQLTRITSHGS
jgi:hypothetical protein